MKDGELMLMLKLHEFSQIISKFLATSVVIICVSICVNSYSLFIHHNIVKMFCV